MTTANAKRAVRGFLGPTASIAVGNRLDDARVLGQTCFTSHGRHSAQVLSRFHNRYFGKTCVIIGNGPSLKGMDLSILEDVYTFGMNRIYLMFERLGFSTTFYVAVNRYVIEQCVTDIRQLTIPKFLSWGSRNLFQCNRDLAFLNWRRNPGFQGHLATRGLWEGGTVTYVALQLAYYMGFSKAILIGVDHHFQFTGPPNQLVTSTGDDPNHFDPSYFGAGFQWQLPDLETSELAYSLAKREYEKSSRCVVNATIGGKLEIFPRVELADTLADGSGSSLP